MHILLIPDGFKDSISAKEICNILSKGLESGAKKITTESCIASDGGDGFLNFVKEFVSTQSISVQTVDPLGRKLVAEYACATAKAQGDTQFAKSSKTAYIELAKASGLELLSENDRNPLYTSTYGTGLQIKDAIEKGCDAIYVGLGGSATNDGGIGMAGALGYSFIDKNGNELEPVGQNLLRIVQIQKPKGILFPKIYAINDVNNPLTGNTGAAYTYGKQKGADPAQIELLDSGLKNLAAIVYRDLDLDNASIPGSGAAGGSGYGLKTFFDAEFISGIDFLTEISGIKNKLELREFDAIITGEGSLDQQTFHGKLVKGICDMSQTFGIPVIAICGKNFLTSVELSKLKIKEVFELSSLANSKEDSIHNASQYLKKLIPLIQQSL